MRGNPGLLRWRSLGISLGPISSEPPLATPAGLKAEAHKRGPYPPTSCVRAANPSVSRECGCSINHVVAFGCDVNKHSFHVSSLPVACGLGSLLSFSTR